MRGNTPQGLRLRWRDVQGIRVLPYGLARQRPQGVELLRGEVIRHRQQFCQAQLLSQRLNEGGEPLSPMRWLIPLDLVIATTGVAIRPTPTLITVLPRLSGNQRALGSTDRDGLGFFHGLNPRERYRQFGDTKAH